MSEVSTLGPIARILVSVSDSDFKSSRLPRLSLLQEELFGEESRDEISLSMHPSE